MIQNLLKEKLKTGEAAAGMFMTCNAPDLVEIAAIAGFDFVIIDGEHGPMGPESIQGMIRAAEVRNITPIVRIPNHLESSVLHNLDIGAHGLQIPQVNDAKTAETLIGYGKYEPIGHRGIAFPRAADYGMSDGYFEHENKETMFVMHCENEKCLENLEEICRNPEVDVIFLGPYDMSQSMGITGQVNHPKVEAAASKVLEICKKYGKVAGIYCGSGDYCGSGEIARKRREQGFRYLAIGMDITAFAAKCREEIKGFRGEEIL